MEWCRKGKPNKTCYFHNLKFDGSFWLHYLMTKTDYKADYTEISDTDGEWNDKYKMPKKTLPKRIMICSFIVMMIILKSF